jgi:DNA-binding SARP family transcriptional activator
MAPCRLTGRASVSISGQDRGVGAIADMSADDPGAEIAELFEQAWDLEPGLRLSERTAVLARIEELIGDAAGPAPPGRDWAHELAAEHSVDLARLKRFHEATTLARRVLADAPPGARIARARATEGLGRALAWTGTDGATSSGRLMMIEAARLYGELGRREWQAYAIFFRGNSVHLQNGELLVAEQCMREALMMLPPDSPRRATVLSFYCDVLLGLGRWDDMTRPLDEGAALAAASGDPMSRAYISWARAKLASVQGDALATERYIREAERETGDWFEIHTGSTFLADAAEMLDRVGQRDQAERYLARALERDATDEFVLQARAALLARGGDPHEALDALQDLARGDWLEKRMVWRYSVLIAFATLRAGGGDAGSIAARALEQAVATGGIEVATRGEPGLVAALLPLAEEAGSEPARAILAGEGEYVIRLFGQARIVRRDGTRITLPAGQPSELVRMLAVHPQGLPVETVLDWFYPDVPLTSSRHRLRQVLTRLRAAAGDLVERTDDHLTLTPAWIDLRAFRSAADRVRAARGPKAVELAYGALAIWTGPPLPADPYTSWASEHRRLLSHRYLSLLDRVALDAGRRGSHEEALAAVTAAIEADPDDDLRYEMAAEHLRALGRHAAARHLTDRRPAEDK